MEPFVPNYFLFPSGQPSDFRLTQKGRAALAPRFARWGIALDSLRTVEDWERAIARVIVRDYNALTPEQRADSATVRQIYDLQFVTDSLNGIPPQPIAERRASRNRVMAKIASPDYGRETQSSAPRPIENHNMLLDGIVKAFKRLWAMR